MRVSRIRVSDRMVIIRNRISSARAGGPRQFSELRDKIIVESSDVEDAESVVSELRDLGFSVNRLNNSPVVIADAGEDPVRVFETMRERVRDPSTIGEAIDVVRDAEGQIDASLTIRQATLQIRSYINQIEEVVSSSFGVTFADYGPENLRMSPFEMDTLSFNEAQNGDENVKDLYDKLEITAAHEEERGDQAIVAIFDTGYAEDIVSEDRIVDTFHGDDVDSVYESQEGHGTMCAGAAAANGDEAVPFDGAAPDAGVILVRTTDSEGQIRSDYISQAWDWLVGLDTDRPIITNHSYGTPLCSGRPRNQFCQDPMADVIERATEDEMIFSVYAAGNEAQQCGHRPSGITNAVTGHNSLASVITVGALRYDLREAQIYSSHGRGDCAPIADPKPNVSCALPTLTYYGGQNGTIIKDMSSGIGGSAGGTSHAAPTTAGVIALVQSKAMKERGEPINNEELKQILRDTSVPPRTTQINAFGLVVGREGYDARFGNGQIQVNALLEEV